VPAPAAAAPAAAAPAAAAAQDLLHCDFLNMFDQQSWLSSGALGVVAELLLASSLLTYQHPSSELHEIPSKKDTTNDSIVRHMLVDKPQPQQLQQQPQFLREIEPSADGAAAVLSAATATATATAAAVATVTRPVPATTLPAGHLDSRLRLNHTDYFGRYSPCCFYWTGKVTSKGPLISPTHSLSSLPRPLSHLSHALSLISPTHPLISIS
jgi:hypothetical protein